MAFTHNVGQNWSGGGLSVSKTTSYSATLEKNLSEPIADSSTDLLVVYELDVSEVKSFYMVCDQAVTVEINNSTTGTPTIVLVANVPYIWTTDSYETFLLNVDVTAVYVTNASGSAATLDIRCVVDATP